MLLGTRTSARVARLEQEGGCEAVSPFTIEPHHKGNNPGYNGGPQVCRGDTRTLRGSAL